MKIVPAHIYVYSLWRVNYSNHSFFKTNLFAASAKERTLNNVNMRETEVKPFTRSSLLIHVYSLLGTLCQTLVTCCKTHLLTIANSLINS